MNFVDLHYCGLAPSHGANSLANHGKEGLAANLALNRSGRSENFAVGFILGFEREDNVVIVVEPNFVAFIGAVSDNSPCNASGQSKEQFREIKGTFIRKEIIGAKAPRKKLNLELKRGVCGNFRGRAIFSIRKFRGARQHANLAFFHTRNTLIPS